MFYKFYFRINQINKSCTLKWRISTGAIKVAVVVVVADAVAVATHHAMEAVVAVEDHHVKVAAAVAMNGMSDVSDRFDFN